MATQTAPKVAKISESELQTMTEKDMSQLEEGLTFIDHFVPVGSGIIDTLALDKDNDPVVIEYKVVEGEDETALLQTLSYADWIDRNPDAILRFVREKKPESNVESLGDVRIIIIAPNFTGRLIQAVRMIEPDIVLKRYLAFEHPGLGKWLHFETVFDSRIARPEIARIETYSVEDHFYGSYAKMRPLFDRLVEEAKKLGEDVRLEFRKYYIALRRTYNFAIIYPYTSKIEVGLHLEAPEPDPRLLEAGWGFSRILHRVVLTNENDLDAKFLGWLKASYDTS